MITIILHILFLQASRAQTVPSQPACEIINSLLNCTTFPKDLICASNGVEYPTHCDFAKNHCENPTVHIVREGACPRVTSPQPTTDPLCDVVINSKCPHDANQVCGSDGRNYHNLCSLHKVACGNPQLAVAHKGPCAASHSTNPPPSSAPSTADTQRMTTPTVTKIETVMTQGSTRTMPTTMTAAIRTTMDPALCQAILVVACGHTLDEVCGSDGKAYKNRCEFEKAVCRDATLREVSLDNCPILTNPPTTQTTTTTTAVPTTQTTPDVTVTFGVLCRAILVAICPPEVKEVCGSDGKTYKNICRFQKAKCYYPDLTSTSGYCKVVQPTSTQQATTTLTTITSQHVTTKGTVSSTAAQQTATLKTITATTPMTSSPHVTNKVTVPSTAAKQMTTTTAPLVTKTTTSKTTTAVLSSLCQVIVTLPCSGDDTTCATDGKIYTNKCEYSKAKCYRPSLDIAASGSCAGHSLTTAPPKDNLTVLEVICGTLMKVKCVDDSQPVCASNNVTYDNECEYEKARCKHKNLHVLRFQPCVSK